MSRLRLNEIFLNPRFPPAPFFHKAMWERQVLWGCERIYSFSQKKIGRHPPPTVSLSGAYALHRRRLMPLNLMEALSDSGRQEEPIFSIHFPNSDMQVLYPLKPTEGWALHVTHSHTHWVWKWTNTIFFDHSLALSCIVVLLITTSCVISPIAPFLDKDKPSVHQDTKRTLYI